MGSRGELRNKLNKVELGANELYRNEWCSNLFSTGWSTAVSLVKSTVAALLDGGRAFGSPSLQRLWLCRRADATGVKLLGGDFERNADSGKFDVTKDSGMIPGQHRLSANL